MGNATRTRRGLAALGVLLSLMLTACFVSSSPPRAGKSSKKLVTGLASGDDTRAKLRKDRNADDSKSRYLAVQAKRNADEAETFVSAPYELRGTWSVEITCGLYKEKKAARLGDGFFGLEISPYTGPRDFYAVYGRYDEATGGVVIFAVTHDGVQGADLPFAARKFTAVIRSDGVNVTLGARPDTAETGIIEIATVPLEDTGVSHQAGFGAFEMGGGALVGFTNLNYPENTLTAVLLAHGKVSTERALDHVKEGGRWALGGFTAMNRGVPTQNDIFNIFFRLDQAASQYLSAATELESLPRNRDRDKAIDVLRSMADDIYFASVQFDRHAPEKAAKRGTKVLLEHIPRKTDIVSRLIPFLDR